MTNHPKMLFHLQKMCWDPKKLLHSPLHLFYRLHIGFVNRHSYSSKRNLLFSLEQKFSHNSTTQINDLLIVVCMELYSSSRKSLRFVLLPKQRFHHSYHPLTNGMDQR